MTAFLKLLLFSVAAFLLPYKATLSVGLIYLGNIEIIIKENPWLT